MSSEKPQLCDLNCELSRLWDKEQGEQKIRASLFNLIIYVQSAARVPYIEQVIKSVISKFPCRVIFIISGENPNEAYLRTSVSSETLGSEKIKIYCEIIRLEVSGHFQERVPFIVLPQILPDLPVYLLWTEDPLKESVILPHLEPLAQRIIFDAESTSDLQSYSKRVLNLIEQFQCAIGDLNWSAISGWRKIFANLFNSPQMLLFLAQSSVIQIQYNLHAASNHTSYHQHVEIEGAYLQAWLASRLNWKFQNITFTERNIRLTYQRPLGEIVILLIGEEIPHLPLGAITLIEIENKKTHAHYVFKRHSQTRQVFIQYFDKDTCELPQCISLAGSVEGQEILEEIFYPASGKFYQQMLETLSRIPWRHS